MGLPAAAADAFFGRRRSRELSLVLCEDQQPGLDYNMRLK